MDILELPSLEKTKLPTVENKPVASCCVQPKDKSTCCTPNEAAGENGGDCCEQPSNGSACCNK